MSQEAPMNTQKFILKKRQHTKFADIKLPFLFHELVRFSLEITTYNYQKTEKPPIPDFFKSCSQGKIIFEWKQKLV